MASPPLRRASTSWASPGLGPLVLTQEDPSILAPKGHGTLQSLIRNRSATSLSLSHFPAAGWRSDEEIAPGGRGAIRASTGFLSPGSEWTGFRWRDVGDDSEEPCRLDDRRLSAILNGPQVRSMRLIGNSNPRYRWERYWKTEQQLKTMKKKIRPYYERCNYLVQQYLFIDRLLDSSLPHDLLNEYNDMPANGSRSPDVPDTISEEPSSSGMPGTPISPAQGSGANADQTKKVKRTPRDIYRPTEITPLLAGQTAKGNGTLAGHGDEQDVDDGPRPEIPWIEEEDIDSNAHIVTVAIYVTFAANTILLLGKIIVVISVPSVSVLASLVDAVLDFLSTAIVWTTTWLISRQDQYRYPIGRRRLEPLGVLVFSVIMITSFVQVSLEAIQRLMSDDRSIIQLGIPPIAIMVGTIVIKGLCWLWCRLVKNSSVQALAADASTDVIFNAGSIAFPIVGFYARIWWLDALGGLLLSLVVIFNWSQTSLQHIKNLSGFSATADQRNILLYLTMRFAKTIRQIQGLQAYHAGDKLNVEVDIVLDENTSLKDSHDLAESLQYVLESVPIVDRAFVHVDYSSYNLPTHMQQQAK